MPSTEPPTVTLARGGERRGMSCWGKGAIGCGVLALLLLAAVIYLVSQLNYVPPHARAGESTGDAAKVERVEDQLEAARSRAAAGIASEVIIQVTEADVNAYFRQHAGDMGQEGLRDPRVRFLEGVIEVGGFAQRAGREIYVTITARPSVTAEGRVRVEILDIRAGRLSLPRSVAQQAQRELEEALSGGEMEQMQVESVQARTGELTITGRVTPRR
ncbi:MAG: hypothetical protein ACE5R4_13495 [Armatimonadota bacterium]